MDLSFFGEKFTRKAGILQLMEDLGNALAGNTDSIMMGGGNPGHIPEVESFFQKELQNIIDDPDRFQRLIGIYDPPRGECEFLDVLVDFFNKEFSWGLTKENICLTNGSQSAFFILFNMLAGRFSNGGFKRIAFPLTPEYIGYADSGLEDDFFSAIRPLINISGDHRFKYNIDFNNLDIDNSTTGAICVSRPTNPTGNVLTDKEVETLIDLASSRQVPLILDSAYGSPFPGLIFTDARAYWNENIILCMSLSKLGLPSVRTGIVVAKKEIIDSVSRINAIVNLATGSFGSMLVMDLFRSGAILDLSKNLIRPYYEKKMQRTLSWMDEAFDGLDYYIHQPEGAMFFWVWFKGLPGGSQKLYEILKKRNVIIVPGHYFFPGLKEDWDHKWQCLRVTYSQGESAVQKGIGIIAEEVKKLYRA